MRVFVTGASGHLGSAVVPELLEAGHHVTGLARSDASAAVIKELGADVRRGDFTDLDGLREAAAEADAVIHLAFNHDTLAAGGFADAAATDHTVVRALGDALAGTGKALVGVGFKPTGIEAVDATINANPRSATARMLAELANEGVRSVLVGVPPVVHSVRDRHGFVPTLIGIARSTGVSGYLGDGSNLWPAAHALDVGRLYRLALEKAPAGAQVHAATEEGVPVREIAEAIARHLGVPAVSIPAQRAEEHFGFFATFAGMNLTMPNAGTRRLLGWDPVHPGLLADLEEGHYFTTG
ncbi:SDR family oxidoreductase [Nonomuraea monospora]|uniref:SDR family oxidoreductase n=1 Tax=Nonomuraea monospora TaxID=568818 RepID=A0ABP5NWQ7_9ACTN